MERVEGASIRREVLREVGRRAPKERSSRGRDRRGGHDGRNRRGQLVSGGRGRERKAFRSGPMDQGSQGERSSGAFPSLAQAVR